MSAPELAEPFSDSIALGGGDCETCGYSFDELRVSQDEESGLYDVSLSWGCYSGESDHDLTAGDAALYVRQLAKDYGFGVEYLGAVEIMAQGLDKRAEVAP